MKIEIEYQFLNHPSYLRVKEVRNYNHDNYPIMVGKIIRELNDKGHTLNSIQLLEGSIWLRGKKGIY